MGKLGLTVITIFKMLMLRIFLIIFSLTLVSAGQAIAVEESSSDLDNYFIEGEKWKEGKIILPRYPRSRHLMEFTVDSAGAPFEYFIDRESLSIGQDYIVRFTVVIKSKSGAENVIYEGIRCETQEYKTYAYGSQDEKFMKASNPSWNILTRSGGTAYRYELYANYLCGNSPVPLKISEMIRRIEVDDQQTNLGSYDY
ncbi:MAG: CNP1-like family protein [Gammaproteobacteria bacterium]|nr:MAG: CNP1-like family protein [Gammaproteobacteria bacterium]